jgi:divalent metal cation (Fe/Co/Zn/Cd) transporter
VAAVFRGGRWQTNAVAIVHGPARKALLRRGFALEYTTLAWNVAGIAVLAVAAISARSVALAGFGLDSLVEIGASTVVIWELSGAGERRQRRGLRLIGYAFGALAAGKARTGQALDNPALKIEGRVTLIDGILASAVLLGLALNAALGWWWADPAAGYVLVCYAAREARQIFFGDH